MAAAVISQAGDDLIVASEVSSRAYYEKRLRRPEWPGERSGVTIGIGYDLGYASSLKVKRDWGDRVSGAMVDAMVQCVALTGDAARRLLPQVRDRIDVPWDAAIYVYETIDIPEWVERVCRAIPGAERLHPHCLGALTSLAYNRGASFQTDGDRYREMRAIRSHLVAGELDQVDDELRAMKRLWPNSTGLRVRRDKEADLWNLGLVAPSAPLPKSVPSASPPPLAPAPKSGVPEGGAGTGGAIITGKAAQEAASAGHGPLIVGVIVVGGLIVTAAAIAYVKYRRSQPVLARAKG